MAVVLVKEEGAACGPGPARVQPSSPEQLARHGVLRRGLPALDPDWTAITGTVRDREAGLWGLSMVTGSQRPVLPLLVFVRQSQPCPGGQGEGSG